MDLNSVRPLVLTIALIAALAMAPVAPEAGNILYLIAGGVALLLLRPSGFGQITRPVVAMPLMGLVVLAVAYSVATGSLQGLAGLMFFAPLFLIPPLLALVPQAGLRGTAVAVLSLCGVAGTAAVAIGEFLATGTSRVGLTVANPIHFADVALASGFIALLGVVYTRGPLRYLYLAGPVLAAVGVLLSGTRGAVVALAMMVAAAIVLVIAMRLVNRRVVIFGSLAAAVLGLAAIAAGALETSGAQRVLMDLTALIEAGVPTDESTSERVQMYTGGFKAFLDAPVFGHGPFDYVAAAAARMSVPFSPPHLHSDIVNFAASGGVLGIVAYLLFLLAPLVEVLRAPAFEQRRGLLVVVSVLVLGFFVMGSTNAVLGLLTLTVLYSCISVVVGALCGQANANEEGRAGV